MIKCVIAACAGSFEHNASVIRVLAVARWHGDKKRGCHAALSRTEANLTLADQFGLKQDQLVGWTAWLRLVRTYPSHSVAVHLVNVSIKNVLMAAVVRLRGGLVIADWDEWASEIPAKLPRKLMWICSERALFILADKFVVASRYLQVRMQLLHSAHLRVEYVPYGLTIENVSRTTDYHELPQDRAYIAYVGSFTANYVNDISELLRLARLCALMDLHVLIIGYGPLSGRLRSALAEQNLPATLLGRVENVDVWLSDPRVIAGFLPLAVTRQNLGRCPNKLFHYIKASLPIVTSPIGEALEALGRLGCYYKYGDDAGLSEALAKAVSQRPVYAVERFTWASRLSVLDPWFKRTEQTEVIL